MKLLNSHTIRNISAVFLAMLLMASSSASAALLGNVTRAEIKEVVNPIYPMSLSSMGIYEGSATLLIELDSEGKMTDWLAVSASKPEFVTALERVIDKWTFTPATRDGENIPYALSVNVKFKSEGIMMAVNGVQMVQAYLYGRFDTHEERLVSQYSELDKMPTPVNIVQPKVFSDIPEEDKDGYVVLGFFIDNEGNVRMPVLMEYEGDIRLAYSAYDALVQWKFEAPKVNGKTTMCRASQKFIFTSGKK